MKAVMGFITVLTIPLAILNMLGGVVSGVWLVVLRDWGVIGLGIALFFVSAFLLGIALMPSMLLAAPAAYFAERGKTVGLVFFGTLSSLYILALITIWCCAILFAFTREATTTNYIPRLIWSYGVATGPWAYMASKDTGSDGQGIASTLAVLFAELAYVAIMLLAIFSAITFLGALKIFGGFMAVGLVIQITLFVMIQREQKSLVSE